MFKKDFILNDYLDFMIIYQNDTDLFLNLYFVLKTYVNQYVLNYYNSSNYRQNLFNSLILNYSLYMVDDCLNYNRYIKHRFVEFYFFDKYDCLIIVFIHYVYKFNNYDPIFNLYYQHIKYLSYSVQYKDHVKEMAN